MATESPTLADAIIREWLKPFYKRHQRIGFGLARKVAEAKRYVLDENMSAFLADLAWASTRTKSNPAKEQALLDTMRGRSRLPHGLTWIEYDLSIKCERARTHYQTENVFIGDGKIPRRAGWLCIQHPQIDTCFMAIQCVSDSTDRYGRTVPTPSPATLAYQWRTDDGPLAWARHPWTPRPYRTILSPEMKGPVTESACLLGSLGYSSPHVSYIPNPVYTDSAFARLLDGGAYDPVVESTCDLRYLMALLATINDLPVRSTEVRPSKGYVARGQYRKFVTHHTITLTIPEPRYKRVAVNAIANARRRMHDVSGFWRRDWRKPFSVFCEHELIYDGAHETCKACGGQRVWVHEHQRGDATLGIVTHDYKVTHESERR